MTRIQTQTASCCIPPSAERNSSCTELSKLFINKILLFPVFATRMSLFFVTARHLGYCSVTVTVVCCRPILTQILCVVSQKASASGGLCLKDPLPGLHQTPSLLLCPPKILWDRHPWLRTPIVPRFQCCYSLMLPIVTDGALIATCRS